MMEGIHSAGIENYQTIMKQDNNKFMETGNSVPITIPELETYILNVLQKYDSMSDDEKNQIDSPYENMIVYTTKDGRDVKVPEKVQISVIEKYNNYKQQMGNNNSNNEFRNENENSIETFDQDIQESMSSRHKHKSKKKKHKSKSDQTPVDLNKPKQGQVGSELETYKTAISIMGGIILLLLYYCKRK